MVRVEPERCFYVLDGRPFSLLERTTCDLRVGRRGPESIALKKRMKLILDRMAKAVVERVNQPTSVIEENDAFCFVVEECPCHWRPSHEKPACYVTVGVLMEAMAWITGKLRRVEEVACISNGASSCVYRVEKMVTEEF